MEIENILKKRLCKAGFHDVIVFDETISTNEDAKDFARIAPKPYTVIIANKQIGGKGRQGKSFYSPDGGAYLSVIVEKSEKPLTILTAVALSKTLDEFFIANKIKWVNDIYVDDKKVAGILCESVDGASIIGIGVNLVAPDGGFPNNIPNAGALPISVDRADFIEKLLINLKKEIEKDDIDSALSFYRERDYLKGKKIKIITVNEVYDAQAQTIDDNFNLIIKKDEKEIKLNSGIVSIEIIKED